MPQEPLVIEDVAAADHRILRLKGALLLSNIFDFQARVRSSTARVLILDFSEVPFIDSAGIGALVGAYVNHSKDGRRLAMVGVNQRIHNSLKITQVESFFEYYDSVAAAEAAAAK